MIVGNHDGFLFDFGETAGWFEWVNDYAVIEHGNVSIVLFHYPIVEWYGFGKGSVHLHGHLHNSPPAATKIPPTVRAFNVGVDVCDYSPIGLNEIMNRLSRIPIMKRHKDQKMEK